MRCGRKSGQKHVDAQPFAWLGLDAHLPAMALDDVLDDGQSQPGALLLAAGLGIDAIEAFGHARHMFGLDARTMINNTDLGMHARALDPGQGYLDPLAVGAILDGIVDKVLEHFVELPAIARDWPST